jgi:hypothetical protein
MEAYRTVILPITFIDEVRHADAAIAALVLSRTRKDNHAAPFSKVSKTVLREKPVAPQFSDCMQVSKECAKLYRRSAKVRQGRTDAALRPLGSSSYGNCETPAHGGGYNKKTGIPAHSDKAMAVPQT